MRRAHDCVHTRASHAACAAPLEDVQNGGRGAQNTACTSATTRARMRQLPHASK